MKYAIVPHRGKWDKAAIARRAIVGMNHCYVPIIHLQNWSQGHW